MPIKKSIITINAIAFLFVKFIAVDFVDFHQFSLLSLKVSVTTFSFAIHDLSLDNNFSLLHLLNIFINNIIWAPLPVGMLLHM